MIAKILIGHEEDTSLYSLSCEDDWYTYLWREHMFDTDYESFRRNLKVSFITFNYDRSLEHFMFNAIQKTYNRSDEEVKCIIEQMNIIHLYGSLGPLKWQDAYGYQYSNTDDVRRLLLCIDEIHILQNEREQHFHKAKEIIAQAENVIFMGFGYDPINIDRLDVATIVRKNIIGTTYGYTDEEENRRLSILRAKQGVNIRTKKLTNLPFLRCILPNL